MTKKCTVKTLAYSISKKLNGGLLRLESFVFFKFDNYFCNSTFH